MMAHTAFMASVRICVLQFLFCAGLLCLAAESQAPKPAPAVSPDVVKMLNAQVGWDDAMPGEHNPTGLDPSTAVPFKAISEGESHPGSFHTNGHGHAAAVNLPYVKGKSNGVLKVTIAAKGCSVSLEIPWGNGSYKPL